MTHTTKTAHPIRPLFTPEGFTESPAPVYGASHTLTLSDVLKRGWKRALALKLLGEGHRAPNPYGAAPLRLYSLTAVRRAEAGADFPHQLYRAEGDSHAVTQTGEAFSWQLKVQGPVSALNEAELTRVAQGDFSLVIQNAARVHRLMRLLVAAQAGRRHQQHCKNPELARKLLQMNPLWRSLQLSRRQGMDAALTRGAEQMLLSAFGAAYPQLMRAFATELMLSSGQVMLHGTELGERLQVQLRDLGHTLTEPVEPRTVYQAVEQARQNETLPRLALSPELRAQVASSPAWFNSTQIKRLNRQHLEALRLYRVLGEAVRLPQDGGGHSALYPHGAVYAARADLGFSPAHA